MIKIGSQKPIENTLTDLKIQCIGIVFMFYVMKNYLLLRKKYLRECFILYYLFIFALIFGHVLGLNKTLTFVNFVQNYRLEILGL